MYIFSFVSNSFDSLDPSLSKHSLMSSHHVRKVLFRIMLSVFWNKHIIEFKKNKRAYHFPFLSFHLLRYSNLILQKRELYYIYLHSSEEKLNLNLTTQKWSIIIIRRPHCIYWRWMNLTLSCWFNKKLLKLMMSNQIWFSKLQWNHPSC